MERIASWNKRAKYYVITEPGKKGIQGRTNVGEPPPEDCRLKGCTGEEYLPYSSDPAGLPEVYGSSDSKKKESESQPDTSSTIKPNKDDSLDKKQNWFDYIFGD